MATMPPVFRARGQGGKTQRNQQADARRGTSHSRGYSRRWQKAKATHLQRSPLCRYCELQFQRAEPANTVDHLYPHEGDQALFWTKALWVSSCPTCHSGFKQSVERQGRVAIDRLADQLGYPKLSDLGLERE